jgi:hypothetical protein
MADNPYEQHKLTHPPSGLTKPETEAAPPDPNQTLAGTVGRGLGLGVRDLLEGSVGPAYDIVGAGINAGAGLTGQPPPIAPFSENLTKLGLPEPKTDTEKFISGVSRPISGALSTMGAGGMMTRAAPPVVQGVGEMLTTQPVGQVVAAGAGGATEQATGSPAAGMAVSMGLPFAGAGLRAAGRELERAVLGGGITPENAQLGQRAIEHYGIPIAAHDLSDNSLVRIGADQGGKLPLSGAEAADHVKKTAWQGAIAREMGEPNATAFTPEVLTRARDRIGQTFDGVAARTRIAPAETAAMGAEFGNILPDAGLTLQTEQFGQIRRQIENINGLVARNNGEIPGDVYQTLTHHGGPLARLESSADPDVAHYAGRIRDALDDAFVRSASQQDQDALNQARYQYRVMRTVDQLAAGSRDGGITPLGFMNAVKTASRRFDPNTGGLAYTGGGNIGELARIGTLMRPAQNSGTTDRALITGLTVGAPAMLYHEPAVAALAGAGLVGNRMMGGYLRNPETTSRLAEGAITPGAGPRINRLATGMLDAARLAGATSTADFYQNQRQR